MTNESDLGYWEKPEPEDLTEELETIGYRFEVSVEEIRYVMEVQAEQNAEALEALRKPVASETGLYQTGWLFTEEDLKEIA